MASLKHRPTLKSLALGLGLSVSTVSKALKGASDVGAQTIAAVRQAAAEAGYEPDLRGVKLRTGRTFLLYYQKAVAPMQDVPDAIVAAQIETIASSLTGTPYQLQIVPWNTATEDPLPAIRRIVEGRLASCWTPRNHKTRVCATCWSTTFPLSPLGAPSCCRSTRMWTLTTNKPPLWPRST